MMRLPGMGLWRGYSERWRTSAGMCLISRWELEAVRQYLVKEGEYEI